MMTYTAVAETAAVNYSADDGRVARLPETNGPIARSPEEKCGGLYYLCGGMASWRSALRGVAGSEIFYTRPPHAPHPTQTLETHQTHRTQSLAAVLSLVFAESQAPVSRHQNSLLFSCLSKFTRNSRAVESHSIPRIVYTAVQHGVQLSCGEACRPEQGRDDPGSGAYPQRGGDWNHHKVLCLIIIGAGLAANQAY